MSEVLTDHEVFTVQAKFSRVLVKATGSYGIKNKPAGESETKASDLLNRLSKTVTRALNRTIWRIRTYTEMYKHTHLCLQSVYVIRT